MPHRDETRLVQHVVFNLADAFQAKGPAPVEPGKRLLWADRELDLGHGARLLANPQNATIVEDSLLREHGIRYALAAWCVMPNHVHVVVEQFPEHKLADVVQTWKSASAHAINKREARRGSVWQREYFDRFMRDEAHLVATIDYVENNPVAARLAETAADWRFSSAWPGRGGNDAGEGAGAPK